MVNIHLPTLYGNLSGPRSVTGPQAWDIGSIRHRRQSAPEVSPHRPGATDTAATHGSLNWKLNPDWLYINITPRSAAASSIILVYSPLDAASPVHLFKVEQVCNQRKFAVMKQALDHCFPSNCAFILPSFWIKLPILLGDPSPANARTPFICSLRVTST